MVVVRLAGMLEELEVRNERAGGRIPCRASILIFRMFARRNGVVCMDAGADADEDAVCDYTGEVLFRRADNCWT